MVIIVNSRGSLDLEPRGAPGKAEQQVTGAGEDAPQPAPQIDLCIGRTAANQLDDSSRRVAIVAGVEELLVVIARVTVVAPGVWTQVSPGFR
jgi:hypothetical protein